MVKGSEVDVKTAASWALVISPIHIKHCKSCNEHIKEIFQHVLEDLGEHGLEDYKAIIRDVYGIRIKEKTK